MKMRPLLVSVLLLTATAGALAADRPEARLEGGSGKTRIVVETRDADGTARQSLVRRTAGRVVLRTSGSDPEGRAAFVTWDEDGQRWSAFSRDGGESWTPARRLRTDLRLRDGEVAPSQAMPAPRTGLADAGPGKLFVVQFRTVSLPEWRDAVTRTGGEVLNYLPHNAHIVRLGRAALARVRELDFVERVEPFHPSYRLEPELREQWLQADGVGFETQRVRVVTFQWGPEGKRRIVEAAEALGAEVVAATPNGQIVELWVDADQLAVLAAHDEVQWIDRWTPPGTDMDLVRQDAGTDFAENTLGYCGQGVRGEVMDGGFQADHQDFDGAIEHGVVGLGSHGTSTYGVVFGNGDRDGDGDGQAIGHLPCAQGIFADYFELTDRFAHTQELKQAPYFASFQSNSWGASQNTSYNSVSSEMDDIIWRLDFAITQSQSNTGTRSSRPQAWAKNIISVGGIHHYDTLDTSDDAWDFGASIGPAQDDRIKPDVAYWYDDIYTATSGSGYTQFGGTSAATPETAGTLGLMVQMWADNVWETDPTGATVFDRQPHASTIKALLINNSQQYEFSTSGDDLSRYKQGWGRPSAQVAYERADNSLVVDEEVLLELNDTVLYDIAVAPGETELKVTMVYPDPPGTTSSSMHRINDLNLKVTSPSSTVYHGNVGLVDGPESVAGGSPDALNTVENVFVRNPEPGLWTVEIDATEVNQDGYLDTPGDDVTYALVVTGGAAVRTDGQGDLRIDPAVQACDQPFELRVRDGNAGSSSLTVSAWSDTEASPETISLQETTSGSGIYRASFDSTSDTPTPGDGVLSVSDGDTVTVEYVDADDGQGGSSVAVQQNATVDCGAPLIYTIATSNVTDTAATITWSTDENSDSAVHWGSVVPPSATERRAGHDLAHTVRINGLTECTTYFFSVESADPVGNAALDDNAGNYFLFTTMTRTDGELHSCREGRLVIEADVVSCAGTVPVRLTDLDLNLDPGLIESVPVRMTSSTETTPEVLTLIETGADTGEFTASMPTGSGAPVPGDGILQASHGDLITGRHDDLDDGTGKAVVSTYTIDADCEAAAVAPVQVGMITADTARVSWWTSELTTGLVEWGPTPALGNQTEIGGNSTAHSEEIDGFGACGRVYLRIVTTDGVGNVGIGDLGGSPYEFNAYGAPGLYYEDGFESDTGWTLEGEWELGAPLGLGSAPGDPTSAFSGTAVLGHDLSGLGATPGDYEPNSSEAAISTVIDASGFTNTELTIRRWINVLAGTFAYIDVKDSGGSWNQLWRSPTSGGLSDGDWSTQTYDISAWADGNPGLEIRFRNVSHIASSFAAGWNIDALSLRDGSQPPFAACGACDGAPSFAGVVTAVDNDPCADSGVTVTWSGAPGWGTGTSGTYAVYRDPQPGFIPGPSNRVASGVADTFWVDDTAPNDMPQHYVVRAENDETCGGGPNNGGLVDGNAIEATGTDATGQPIPGPVGDTLVVETVNGAHVRLSWVGAVDAAAHNVYRSSVADLPFGLESTTPETIYEDRDAATDPQPFYYLVVGADACGNEGP